MADSPVLIFCCGNTSSVSTKIHWIEHYSQSSVLMDLMSVSTWDPSYSCGREGPRARSRGAQHTSLPGQPTVTSLVIVPIFLSTKAPRRSILLWSHKQAYPILWRTIAAQMIATIQQPKQRGFDSHALVSHSTWSISHGPSFTFSIYFTIPTLRVDALFITTNSLDSWFWCSKSISGFFLKLCFDTI